MRFLALLSIISQLTSDLAVGREATTSLIPRAPQSNINDCNADQKAWIEQAFSDAQTLAQSVDPFLPPRWWPFNGIPELEKRYFGSEIDRSNDFKPAMIRNITISCKDIPNSKSLTCGTKVGNRISKIGTYALSEHGKPEIVICPAAFAKDASGDGSWHYKPLTDKKALIDKNPDWKNHPGYWMTAGHLMLHELTHLQFIEGTTSVVVQDHYMNSDSFSKVYGARDCERFASMQGNAYLINADNIAWYVTIKYFSQFYGEPGPVYVKTSSSKAVMNNIALPPSSNTPAAAYNVTSVNNILLPSGSKAPAAAHNVTSVKDIALPPSSKAPGVNNVTVAPGSKKLVSESGIVLIPGTEAYLEAVDKEEHPDNYLEDAYDNESIFKTCEVLVHGECLDNSAPEPPHDRRL